MQHDNYIQKRYHNKQLKQFASKLEDVYTFGYQHIY